jgi:hypothetical protein
MDARYFIPPVLITVQFKYFFGGEGGFSKKINNSNTFVPLKLRGVVSPVWSALPDAEAV